MADSQSPKDNKGDGAKRFATGPGSGPMRGRRQAAAAQAALAPPKPRKIPPAPALTEVWGWAIAGLALLFLAIVFLIPHLVPKAWLLKAPHMSEQISHLLAGLGFLAIGWSRGLSRQTYEIGVMKNKDDVHGWKIPLLFGEGFILYLVGIYVLGVGVRMWQPIETLLGMTVFLILVFGFMIWYLLAFLRYRRPLSAGHFMAMGASLLAVLSLLAWSVIQSLLIAGLLAFYALICGVVSVLTVPEGNTPERATWFKNLFLTITVVALLPVAYGFLPHGKPLTPLVELGSVFKDLPSNAIRTTYSPDGRTLALVQNRGNKAWSLLILDKNLSNPALQVPAGSNDFRPTFIRGGKTILADFTVDGVRNLYRVDTATGFSTPLTRGGIQPVDEGVPWMEKTGRMLLVVQTGKDFEIRSFNPARPEKSDLLFRDPKPLYSPSWFDGGKQICWVGGSVDNPCLYAMDLAEKQIRVLAKPTAEEESSPFTPEGEKALQTFGKKMNVSLAKAKGKEMVRITLASPAPDDFRVLYVVSTGNKSSLWTVLADGEKAKPIYTTCGSISDLQWNPLGQEVVFEETVPAGLKHCFVGSVRNVRLLDLNLGTTHTLVLPQLDHYAPALSPDGVKVAFVGTKNLWFPTWMGQSSVWVAVLR